MDGVRVVTRVITRATITTVAMVKALRDTLGDVIAEGFAGQPMSGAADSRGLGGRRKEVS